MNTKTFDTLREIIYEKSGITLSGNKGALVSARIGKRMRALAMDDARQYVDYLLTEDNEDEMTHMLDAISTNVTSFFREGNHFEFLGATFSQWLAQGRRTFRFWSAACSSGEEPYSLAMTLLDRLNGAHADIKILATDISTKILEKSMQGVYSGEKIAAIPANYKNRFITCRKTGDQKDYEIVNEIKNLIAFQRINLSKPPFPMRGPMDAIFCRNVMIYFDNTVRKALLEDCYRLLKPGGYLFVGHAESLTGLLSGFKPVKASIYIKN